MSAFVVKDATINRVVTFLATDRESDYIRRQIYKRLGVNLASDIGPETLGNLMFSLNCDAVNQRYGENEAAQFRKLDYSFRPEIHCNRLMAYKALECWMYQCSEGNIDENNLYQVMERVQGWIAEMIVTRSAEYDRLGWD